MNSELVSILMERDSGIAEFRGALIVSVTSPKATFFANSARKTDACSERAIMQPSGDLSAQTSRSCDTTKSRVGSFTEIYRRSNGPSCRGGVPSRSDRNALVFSLSLSLSLSELLFILRRIGYCLEEFTTSTLARSLAVVAIAVFPFLLRSSNQLPLPPRHALLQVSPSFP